MTKTVFSVFFLFLLFGLIPSTSFAKGQQNPSATVRLESQSVSIGIGFSWGQGTITYKGRSVPFKIDGLKVVGAGYSGMSAVGEIYNLKQLADFNGTFTGYEAGGAFGGGEADLSLKNQNGVIMVLHGTQKGLSFSLAGSGMSVVLQAD
ncbi:hypothetical protein [Desulfovibrio inopinatus]|uniref:hypothetical protein n=1 Tax=Desulfovibrio inopinatus TaxID=102109 RepID=UPI0003FAB965|nr:hypothetical protein [Desulfovibrio inopinatus]